MNRTRTTHSIFALTVLVMATVLLMPAPGSAAEGDIIVQGACSGSSDWKLKVGFENNGLDVVFEVDQNVDNQLWSVRVRQNNVVLFQGQVETLPPSGSLTVDLLTGDEPGDDRFLGLARNALTGERCRGFLTFPEGLLPEGFSNDE